VRAKLLCLAAGIALVSGCASGGSSGSKSATEPARAEVRTTVLQHMDEVRHCYEQALDETPLLEGKLVMQWEIPASGRPEAVEVASSTGHIQEVIPCLAEHIKTWIFSPSQPSVIRYPFYFSENGRFPHLEDKSSGN
jgi:hypothetical protein